MVQAKNEESHEQWVLQTNNKQNEIDALLASLREATTVTGKESWAQNIDVKGELDAKIHECNEQFRNMAVDAFSIMKKKIGGKTFKDRSQYRC